MTATNSWLRSLHRPKEDSPTLICFPHAGASAQTHHLLSSIMAAHSDVRVIQYPGRHDRHNEPLEPDILSVAEAVAGEIRQEHISSPTLYGHSMGAVAAFETARCLVRENTTVAALVVTGRRSPTMGEDLKYKYMTDEEILHDVKNLGGTGSILTDDSEACAMIIPALRNDYQAVGNYRYQPGPLLPCPITAVAGTHDRRARPAQVAAWGGLTEGPFRMEQFEAGHFFDEPTLRLKLIPLLLRSLPPTTPAGRGGLECSSPGEIK